MMITSGIKLKRLVAELYGNQRHPQKFFRAHLNARYTRPCARNCETISGGRLLFYDLCKTQAKAAAVFHVKVATAVGLIKNVADIFIARQHLSPRAQISGACEIPFL
jgi:hypothetical protein